MFLWSAFILGLAGSLHCVGMCGPIALALPVSPSRKWKPVAGRMLYNAGRIVTYATLGLGVGLLGESLAFAGLQQILSLVAGAALLLGVLFNLQWESRMVSIPLMDRMLMKLKKRLGSLLHQANMKSMFHIGLLNGLLPCGFVYIALAGAISTGDTLSSAGYMALFGLGTFPAMLALSIAGNYLKKSLGKAFRPLMTGFAICFAILLILRGLNLGIPFVSPQIDTNITRVQQCQS